MNYLAGFLRTASYAFVFLAGVAIGIDERAPDYLPTYLLLAASVVRSAASTLSSFYWLDKGTKKRTIKP